MNSATASLEWTDWVAGLLLFIGLAALFLAIGGGPVSNDELKYLAAAVDTAARPHLLNRYVHIWLEKGFIALTGDVRSAMALFWAVTAALTTSGVWFATRLQIAQHWAATHPPVARPRPSQMAREEFVQAWGGVFEHSPWIAERAFDLELGPAHDTAGGLHNALARVFRSASEDERLGVLKAHPDLAGKLAQARRLTAQSTSEQAKAGLDELTDQERTAFGELNDAYTAKFGFPFIIAVRDNSKSAIMAAFKRRLANDRDTEFKEACAQVERIAELRLRDMLPS